MVDLTYIIMYIEVKHKYKENKSTDITCMHTEVHRTALLTKAQNRDVFFTGTNMCTHLFCAFDKFMFVRTIVPMSVKRLFDAEKGEKAAYLTRRDREGVGKTGARMTWGGGRGEGVTHQGCLVLNQVSRSFAVRHFTLLKIYRRHNPEHGHFAS